LGSKHRAGKDCTIFDYWKGATTMESRKRDELETRVREVLKDHQRNGLNMIGNVEQLTRRLVEAVESWVESEPLTERKSA
jgi:hypothetical protein